MSQDISAAPAGVLNDRAPVAATRAPRPLPKRVARSTGAQRMTAMARESGAWCEYFSQ